MPLSNLSSDESSRRIAEAVRSAEARTSGEIVPVIVPQSSEYGSVDFKASLFGVALGLIGYEAFLWNSASWGGTGLVGAMGISLFVVAGLLTLFLCARGIPAFRRWLIGKNAMDAAVHSRAVRAFVDHEVFTTRERTGIVLLLSVFEHRVEVFGDSGINQKVEPEEWATIIEAILKGVKGNDPTQGFVNGIEACGDLLEKAGVAIRKDDTDELSNLPRFE